MERGVAGRLGCVAVDSSDGLLFFDPLEPPAEIGDDLPGGVQCFETSATSCSARAQILVSHGTPVLEHETSVLVTLVSWFGRPSSSSSSP